MITRINLNRPRKFLNPFEIESQYITEDRATNPDLLAWYDFTDVSSLRSVTSGGASVPTTGQKILLARNKSYDGGAGVTSAGEKALGEYISQTGASSKAPVWIDPGGGGIAYAGFDGDDYLIANGSVGKAGSSDFSTSTISTKSFSMYVVAKRDDPGGDTQQDLVFMRDNTGPNPRYVNMFFNGTSPHQEKLKVFQVGGGASGLTDAYVQHDVVDDEELHYHFYSPYESYFGLTGRAGLFADGHFNVTQHDYTTISSTATYDEELDFTGTSNMNFIIGGQQLLGSSTLKGTFKGRIYEVLIFKSQHGSGHMFDVDRFKERWSNMLYYFQRKYQFVASKT